MTLINHAEIKIAVPLPKIFHALLCLNKRNTKRLEIKYAATIVISTKIGEFSSAEIKPIITPIIPRIINILSPTSTCLMNDYYKYKIAQKIFNELL